MIPRLYRVLARASELREADAHIWYRVAYLPRKGNVVYVLHAFEKQGAKTPRNAVATIEQRLKAAREMMKKEKEKEKEKEENS